MWQHDQRLQVYYNPRYPKQNSLHQGEQLETDGLLAGLALVVIIDVFWSFGSDSAMR